VIHVRARDGRSRPDAAVRAPSWFMCGHGARGLDAGVPCGPVRGHGMWCGWASSGAGAELCSDEHYLQSGIWCGAKEVACIRHECGSCVWTHTVFRMSGR
jgi:hypothetical protein